jgi:hypothetical protein
MSEKEKLKNQKATQYLSELVFAFLVLLCFLSVVLGRWIIFEQAFGIVLWIGTLVFGLVLCMNYSEQKQPISLAIPILILLLVFLFCGMIIIFILAPPTKKCHLESLTVAYCVDRPERFGNAVPEPPLCWWRQYHIAGLILVGGEWGKGCERGG